MNKIIICLIIAGLNTSLICQSKLIDLGMTLSMKDSVKYKLSFGFNKAPKPKDDGPLLWSGVWGNDPGNYYVIKPQVSIDIGNSVESSSDNVNISLKNEFGHQLSDTGIKNFETMEINPNITSDKDFVTGLIYVSFGTKNLTNFGIPKTNVYSIVPGIYFDCGERLQNHQQPGFFYRVSPSLYIEADLFPVRAPEPDNTMKPQVVFSLTAKGYYIKNDTVVISNGLYGYLDLNLSWRNPKNIWGLTIDYVIGHEQPKFLKQNALMVGVSIYYK